MTLAMAVNQALIESLWQGAVVALLLAVTLLVVRAAQARYIASCLAIAALTLWPIATAWDFYSSPGQNPSAVVISWTATLAAPISVSHAIELEQWELPMWLMGVAICSVRLLLGYRRMDLLLATTVAADDHLRAAFECLGGRRVRLAISKLVDVPSVVGYWRPVILVPTAALAGLSAQQLEAILAHELAHIRRGDHWVNMIQCWIEVVMFYHPAAWWISSRMRHERELCCDDAAVKACGDAAAYARALWTLEKLRVEIPRVALASNGGSLLYRIERLTGASRRGTPLLPGLAALVCVVALLPQGAREVSAQPPTPTAPAVEAPRQEPLPVAPPPATAQPLTPKQVADLKAELENAYQESLRERIAYERDVHSADPMLDYNAPELQSLYRRMGSLHRASEELGTGTGPERIASEVWARDIIAESQAEIARLRQERATVLEGADRIFGRTIRVVIFEGIPEPTQAWILESMPNWVGRSYTRSVAENIQSVIASHLGQGSGVELKREDGFALTIVIRGPASQARTDGPGLVNAAYQPPPGDTRMPTSPRIKTNKAELDAAINLAEYWAGWEAGYVDFRLNEKAPDLESAAKIVHVLSRDLSGDPEAEARLREAVERLYSVIEEYRQRRIAIEGKDQRPAEYRKQTSL